MSCCSISPCRTWTDSRPRPRSASASGAPAATCRWWRSPRTPCRATASDASPRGWTPTRASRFWRRSCWPRSKRPGAPPERAKRPTRATPGPGPRPERRPRAPDERAHKFLTRGPRVWARRPESRPSLTSRLNLAASPADNRGRLQTSRGTLSRPPLTPNGHGSVNAEDAFLPTQDRKHFFASTVTETLLAQLQQGLDHPLPVLLVTGAAGVGKSSLVREACARWGVR